MRPGANWSPAHEYEDICYELGPVRVGEGKVNIAKVSINRPQVLNAFRPTTEVELADAFTRARDDTTVGAIILTGKGDRAFCVGGDQSVRTDDGYADESSGGTGRFRMTDFHVQLRRTPKPVVAMVAGYAVGGGQVLQAIADISIAADNAVFGQVGPKVGSFDGGYGVSMLSRLIGPKKAKEMWFLCRRYNATEALSMGLVNAVYPLQELEEQTVSWCSDMFDLSPYALRLLKSCFNADEDGMAGVQQLAHDTAQLFYGSEEAKYGRDEFEAKRKPDYSRFPHRP